MLLADCHGNKREPFIVFKAGASCHKHIQDANDSKRHGFCTRLWKEMSPLQKNHNCQIYGNPKAWWNAQISLKFLDHHFGHRSGMENKVLLLWDDFSGHWTQEVKEYAASINVLLFKVPPRYTYVCQPADMSWNQPFKAHLRSHWLECLRVQIAEHHAQERQHDEKARKIADQINELARNEIQEVAREKIQELQQSLVANPFVMIAPKRPDITAWIAEAWGELSQATIVSGYSKVGLLGDTRSPENAGVQDYIGKIDDVLDRLALLGAADEAFDTGDEFVSSDSSDEE
ncbi:hypothetical protein PR001_g16794 [Phytophthora rubi]|nr:hypothetical protein PR001_g16794 [Phytophthora rubi]